nr:unnamed protein product [Digitaria exilis]
MGVARSGRGARRGVAPAAGELGARGPGDRIAARVVARGGGSEMHTCRGLGDAGKLVTYGMRRLKAQEQGGPTRGADTPSGSAAA